MSTDKSAVSYWSSSLALLVNGALAGCLGWMLGGLVWAVVASMVLIGLTLAPSVVRRIMVEVRRTDRRPVVTIALGALKLAAAPFVMVAALVVTLIGLSVGLAQLAAERLSGRMPTIAIPSPRFKLRRSDRVRSPSTDWKSAENLSMTLANLLLLIVLGCLWYGMEVAFYAALVATPIWLSVLVAVALQASEPDRSIPLPDDGG
jgi:hypothetical protein